jgi:autotransporter translocation and assembly factor TamB
LYGGLTGAVVADSSSLATGELLVSLDTSYVAGSPFDSLRGVVRMRDSVLEIDSMVTLTRGLSLTLDGGIGMAEGKHRTLRVEGDVDSLGAVESLLQEVSPVAGGSDAFIDITGSVNVQATIEGSLDDYSAHVTVTVPQAVSAGASLEGLQLSTAWASALDGQVSVVSALDSVTYGRWVFADLGFNLSGRKDMSAWQGRAALGSDGSLVAGGRAAIDSGLLTVSFDSLALLLPTHQWSLDRRAVVVVSDEGFDLRDVTLTGGTGAATVSFSGRLPREGVGTLRGSLQALPVADVWAMRQVDPATVEGRVSGTFAVGGTARFPELNAALALDDGRFGSFRTPHLEGSAAYTDRRLRGSYELWRTGEPVVTVEFDLPLDLALTDVDERLLPGLVTVRAIADDVDPSFVELFTPLVRGVGGRLEADFGITGSWDRPQLTGNVAIADGRVSFPNIGVTHERINGRLALYGDTIAVESLTLASGDGEARIAGFVRLEGFTKPVMDLQIVAEQFHTIDVPDFLTATSTADLALQGPVFGARLRSRREGNRQSGRHALRHPHRHVPHCVAGIGCSVPAPTRTWRRFREQGVG